MKKINVVLIGLLVCIAYYFYFSEYIDKANKRYEEEQGKLLLQVQPDDITGISGTLEGVRFDMLKQNGKWSLALPVVDDVKPQAINDVLLALSEMRYESFFEPDDGDYSIFELENPHYVWNIKNADGKVQTLKIGDINIMGSKGYARIGDEPEVYIIPLSDRNVFIKRLNDFRETKIHQGDIEQLDKIEITRAEETILLARKNGKWGLGEEGFPLNDELMRKITGGLASFEIKSFVAEDLDNRENYLSNSFQITFFSGDQSIKFIIENAPGKSSRYAIIDGKERIVTVDGSYVENFEHKIDDFRQRKLFTLPVYQATSLLLERNDEKLELKQRENNWLLDKNVKANNAKVYDLIKSYISLEITDFSTKIPAADVQKVVSITLFGTEGEPEKAVIYESLFQQNTFYVVAPNGNDFYPVKGAVSEDFRITTSDLEDRKIFSFDAQEINSILVRLSGGKERNFLRDENVWNGKKGEKNEIIDFLWTLQDASWIQKNVEIPSNITPQNELELSGTGVTLKIQLYNEGFCAVNGKKYRISTEDVGKISDFIDKL